MQQLNKEGRESRIDIGTNSKNHKSLLQDEDLDCICCFEELGLNEAHIYQCSKGHVKCPRCKQKLQSCPQCRKVYGTVGIRNLILESITAKLKPKSQIEKKPVRKNHGCNHSGAKRLMQGIGNDIGNDRNQFGTTYQQQIQQQEQFQQQQHQIQQQEQFQQQLRQTWPTQPHNGHQMNSQEPQYP